MTRSRMNGIRRSIRLQAKDWRDMATGAGRWFVSGSPTACAFAAGMLMDGWLVAVTLIGMKEISG